MVVLAALAVGCLLLAVGLDPGSGTGTNLQAADDVAGLVVGAHHAKPLPAPIGSLLQGFALAAMAVAVVLAVRPGVTAPFVGRLRADETVPAIRSLVLTAAHARRGPPVLV